MSELRLAALLTLLLPPAPCWWAAEGGGSADGGGRLASQASLSGSGTAVADCMVSLRSASVALRTLREAPVAKSTEMILGTTDESRHAASRSSKPCEMRSSEAPGLSRSSCVSRCVSSAWIGVRNRARVRVSCLPRCARLRLCGGEVVRVGAGERDADDGLPRVDGDAQLEKAVGPGEYAGALHEEEDVALAHVVLQLAQIAQVVRVEEDPLPEEAWMLKGGELGDWLTATVPPVAAADLELPPRRLAQLRSQAAGPKAWAPKQLRGLPAPFAGIEPPCSPRP